MSSPPPPPPSPVTIGMLVAPRNAASDAQAAAAHCSAASAEDMPYPAATAPPSLPSPSTHPMATHFSWFEAEAARLQQHVQASCAAAADPGILSSSSRLRNGELARAALVELCDHQACHIRFLATYAQQAPRHAPLSGVAKTPRRRQRQAAGSSSAALLEACMTEHAPTTFITPTSRQDATSPEPPPCPRRPTAHATQRRLSGLDIRSGEPPASPSAIDGHGHSTSASQPRVRAIQNSLLAVAPPPEGVSVLPTYASSPCNAKHQGGAQ